MNRKLGVLKNMMENLIGDPRRSSFGEYTKKMRKRVGLSFLEFSPGTIKVYVVCHLVSFGSHIKTAVPTHGTLQRRWGAVTG